MSFCVEGVQRVFEIDQLVIAGWTGRDREAVEHHIAELAAIGVRRPAAIPCFYRVGTALLTSASDIDVVGDASSGEVEVVLLSAPDGLYVGIGSDHTDRKVETYGVTVSKQMCPKPIGRDLWAFQAVEAHWDRLMLVSYVTRAGRRTLYQDGSVNRMLAPNDLVAKFAGSPGALPPGTAMFCGTLPVLGTIGGGETFEIEIVDTLKQRSLRHAYRTRSLAIAD